MSTDFSDYAPLLTILIIVGIIGFIVHTNDRNKKQAAVNHEAKKKQLYEMYNMAMASGDKQQALQAGRAYYSFIRNGNLTIYDEQALTNDLLTMK